MDFFRLDDLAVFKPNEFPVFTNFLVKSTVLMELRAVLVDQNRMDNNFDFFESIPLLEWP